jgi:hypothetical protein
MFFRFASFMYYAHTFAHVCFWWDETPCGYYDFILHGPQLAVQRRESRWVPPWQVYTEVSPGVFVDTHGDRFVHECFGSADERDWVPA